MSNTQKKWLEVAKSAAVNSTCRSKHGAVIVSGGRILSVGINRSRLANSYANWWEDGPAPSTHAEVSAIKQCKGVDLSNATIYIARVNRRGDEMMSRPCPRCLEACRAVGIRKLVYTISSEAELV